MKPRLPVNLLAMFSLTVAVAAGADDIADAALGLCEKVKSCAMAQIAKEDLTPEVRQMMQPMLDNMCTDMQAKVQAVPAGHAMYDSAVACMRSMAALSCEDMQAMGGNTPACQDYEKVTRKTYGQP